jgi:hypothetical protein
MSDLGRVAACVPGALRPYGERTRVDVAADGRGRSG